MLTRSLALAAPISLATLVTFASALAHAQQRADTAVPDAPGPAGDPSTHDAPAGDAPADEASAEGASALTSAQVAAEKARLLELASIDSESRAATALYVTSLSLTVTALAIGIPTAAAGISCIGAWSSPCSRDGESTRLAASLSSYVLLGLGVIALPIAIGLDVDSGSRRGGWEARAVAIDSVRLAPTEGGAYVAIDGRF